MPSSKAAAKFARGVVLLAGLILPQALLIGSSLLGRKILLPLDLLDSPGIYLPQELGAIENHADFTLSDLVFQLEPNRRFAVSEVRAGRIPLWNPYNYCGAPFLAGNQPAVFAPFRLIDYLWPSPRAIAWGQLIRAIVAGISAYLFFRITLRARFLPAAIGAWCFPLSGFLTLWAGFLQGWDVTWLPLLLCATHETIRRPASLWRIGLALVVACVLVSGHSATGAQMLLLDGAYAIWAVCRRYGNRKVAGDRARIGSLVAWIVGILRARTAIAALVAGWIIGILLSLPQTLPTLEYMRSSYRLLERQRGFDEVPPIGMAALPEVVLPFFNGSREPGSIELLPRNRLESLAGGYAGLVAAFALAPFAWLSRRRRAALLFWLAAAIVGVGQQLDLPLLSSLYRAPLLNALRNSRLVFITGFAILTAAVIGLDVLMGRRARPRWWGAILAAPVMLGAFCLYRQSHPSPRVLEILNRADEAHPATAAVFKWFADMHLAGAIWCGVSALMVIIAMRPLRRREVIVAILGVISIVELLARAWNVFPQSDPALYYPRLAVFDAIAQRGPGRICGVNCLPAQLNLAAAFPDIRGYDSADPVLIVQLLEKIRDPQALLAPYARTQYFFPGGELPLLDLLNLRYLPVQGEPREGAKPAWAGDGYVLIERPSADTRVFVPRHVRVIPEASQRLARLTQIQWNPREELILESNVPLLADTISGSAAITGEEPNCVRIEANMQTPGFVLLADQWDGGWEARVNGSPAVVWRADHAFRAVKVPAGKSTIVFTYAPASFTWGCYGAGIGAIALSAGIFANRRRKSPAPQQE